ncbi:MULTISPECIES: isoprenyl transferase [Sphingobacterium]|uniref:Isoprenyl transferase n=1 Tax=Sphingobacterium litopenaei TaxID=2763500 RepID=A0ABR7Y9R0_9SPHI|nr:MULTISPECIES: isoprenyl transferase [Sphingobacterium]MBD1428036.1 isoprenyl transferase [Sphingobacterium litopenaei]NGM72024.1 isoprenyl transferase [Sphingobacterium sp. SGL-16]
MSLKNKIDRSKLPQHIAIIMDGNGRWAKGLGKLRVFGHKNGVTAVREVLEGAIEVGVKHLTLYAFSSENWSRPKMEVQALMELLINSLNKELPTFQENGVRVKAIGSITNLPSNCQKTLADTIELTKNNTTCVLTLALSYGSRDEIIETTKNIAQKVAQGEIKVEDINDNLFSENLQTAGTPDPDLMIRTSGEQRISNFLLWQLAYTELWFSPKLWPDFTREDLFGAILDFQNRERRFGKTSEQL